MDMLARPDRDEDLRASVAVPDYLRRHYWWAYIHPLAVKFFDHFWIVNLILLCNFRKLRDAALAEFAGSPGRVLQLACVYCDLVPRLVERITAKGGNFDIVDVLPIQLSNLKRKLGDVENVRLLNMNSASLALPSANYDWVILFFLLHEQPAAVRARTLEEAFRVLKPGGKVLVVDFAKPYWWSPFRYLWRVFLAIFEPFALDMWRYDIRELVPAAYRVCEMRRERFFGGLFQKVVIATDAPQKE